MHLKQTLLGMLLIMSLIFSTLSLADPVIVADLNLANYDDHTNWDTRSDLIAKNINSSNANIITMQEVRNTQTNPYYLLSNAISGSMGDIVLQKLKNLNPTRFANAQIITNRAMNYDTANTMADSRQWEGLSIIYLPSASIVYQGTGSLPLPIPSNCTGDANNRMVQYLKFLHDNKSTVYIFNTHFSYDKTCRSTNITNAITYIKSVAGDPKNTSNTNQILLAGDFNASDVKKSNSCLSDYDTSFFTTMKNAGFIDVWRKLYPLTINPTSTVAGYTWKTGALCSRVDHIWANNAMLSAISASVRGKPNIAQFSSASNSAGNYPSDHVGLLITLKSQN